MLGPYPSMRHARLSFTLLMLLICIGCASTPPTCLPGTHPIVLDSLYFGTTTPDGVVTEQEWQAFLTDTVGAEFPEGLTSWTGHGRWRNSGGSVAAETSYLLQLAHDGGEARERGLQRLIQTYKTRFHQKAVMRIRSQACRSF
ncbi:MAG TPA: DUF3574 domain-containing protein [Nitrospira sp.]|nr:DUF3574 domain-containing protein [Nitrospira sp.]